MKLLEKTEKLFIGKQDDEIHILNWVNIYAKNNPKFQNSTVDHINETYERFKVITKDQYNSLIKIFNQLSKEGKI